MGTIANVSYEGELELQDRGDGNWYMLSPLACLWTEETERHVMEVPAGFIHDLASVPRALRSFVPVIGPWNKAAVVHDWCYVAQPADFTRWKADALFLAGLKASGVGWITRTLMWLAVRVGGWVYWNKTAAEKGKARA